MDKKKFEDQLNYFINQNSAERQEFLNYFTFPCLNDDSTITGFDTHYLYHVAWAIKKVLNSNVTHHVDISSSLNFCSSICSVVPTTFIDYRPANIFLDNLNCISGDLTDDDQWLHNKFESVSCMHVVEHIGLGRYGDKLDVNGDIKAMNNLINIIKTTGRLLFVVPIGKPQIFFNAHRVYSAQWITKFFERRMKLKEFYFIPGPIELKPILNCDFSYTENFDYGCGCFEFIKT